MLGRHHGEGDGLGRGCPIWGVLRAGLLGIGLERPKVTQVGRAGSPALPDATATLDGNRLIIDRGVAQEQIEAGPSALTQTFVIPTMPEGTGPFEVHIKVDGSGPSRDSNDWQQLLFSLGGLELAVSRVTYSRGELVATISEQQLDDYYVTYPLSLRVSTVPMMRLATPVRYPGGRAAIPRVVCRPDQCLTTWNGESGGQALRTTPDGTRLDSVEISFGSSSAPWWLSADPTGEYLALGGGSNTLSGTYVDAATGAVSHYPSVELLPPYASTGAPEAVAFGSGVHMITYRAGGERRAARFAPGSTTPLSGISSLGTFSDEPSSVIAAGVGQFAVVEKNQLKRVDAATGAVLDATPITYSQYGFGFFATKPALVFDGSNYVAVWVDSGKLLAARVRASDGVVLDADDTQAQTLGARVLCRIPIPAAVSAHFDGGKLYVTWRDGAALYATFFALDPWLSSNAACPGATIVADAGNAESSVAFAGPHGTAAIGTSSNENDGLRLITFDLTTPNTSVRREMIANAEERYDLVRAIESNGRDFLVTGTSQHPLASFTDPDFMRITFTQIDGATGIRSWERAEATNLQLNAFKIAAAASNYLFVVVDDYRDIARVRPISCDGSLGENTTLEGVTTPAYLLGDGDHYLAAFNSGTYSDGLRGKRFDLTGDPVGDWVQLGSPGSRLSGASVTTPANKQTFSLLGNVTSDQRLTLVNVDGDTGESSQVVLLNQADATQWTLGSDGTNLLLIGPSADGRTGMVMSATTGANVVAPKVLDLPQGVAGSSFDGTSHRFHFGDGLVSTTHRLSPTLDSIDGAAGLPNLSSDATWTSNSYGRVLVSYSIGYARYGYFIDNDLAPVDANTAEPNCVPLPPTGTGGQGGSPSGGAAGGSGGTTGGGSAGTGGDTTTGGSTPTTGGTDAATGGTDAATGGTDTATGGTDTATGGTDPATGAAGGDSSNSAGGSPSDAGAAGHGTSTGGGDATDGTDEGCSCRVAGRPTTSPWPLLLGALVLARRRRPRSAASTS